jgi:hypothetical protein
MDQHSDQNGDVHNARVVKRRYSVFRILGVVTFALILAAIIIPHQLVSRVARDEASAMTTLRRLTSLQLQYATSHSSEGFACELARLRDGTPPKGKYGNEEFRVSDAYEGYKFSLTGCEFDANGIVIHYTVTAVPILSGKTGFRAFCSDETGQLWYDVNGSAEGCLTERRPL